MIHSCLAYRTRLSEKRAIQKLQQLERKVRLKESQLLHQTGCPTAVECEETQIPKGRTMSLERVWEEIILTKTFEE